MIRRLAPLALGAAIVLSGCGGDGAATDSATDAAASAPALKASDFPALGSGDCVDVAQFYFEAISGHEYAQAALAWNDPVIDGARLEALFTGFAKPEITWGDPYIEANDDGEFCSISGVLTDASDSMVPAREGTLLLQRRDGERGRWLVESSTFIEDMRRSAKN